MRMILSVVGLLLTLAVLGWVAKQQLRSVTSQAPQATVTSPASNVALPAGNQVEQIKSQVEQTLAQGAAASASAADR